MCFKSGASATAVLRRYNRLPALLLLLCCAVSSSFSSQLDRSSWIITTSGPTRHGATCGGMISGDREWPMRRATRVSDRSLPSRTGRCNTWYYTLKYRACTYLIDEANVRAILLFYRHIHILHTAESTRELSRPVISMRGDQTWACFV